MVLSLQSPAAVDDTQTDNPGTVGALTTLLPLRYAQSTYEVAAGAEMLATLLDLAESDDVLVLMQRDGSYGAFCIDDAKNATPLMLSSASAVERFSRLHHEFAHVWVLLIAPRGSASLTPPAQYRSVLQTQYMAVPLPFPAYYAARTTITGTTAMLSARVALLERIRLKCSTALSAQFFLDLGQLYQRLGEVTNAHRVYIAGAASFPEDPYLQRRLADSYFTAFRDYTNAITYNKAAVLNYKRMYGAPMYEAMFSIAMSYERDGELDKAQIQYQSILAQLEDVMDPLWQSRTRRYLGDLLLKMGDTNAALAQFQLDTRSTAQHPAYSYNKVLDLSAALRRPVVYADAVRAYYAACNTNDAQAIVRYVDFMHRVAAPSDAQAAVKEARQILANHPALLQTLQATPAWWQTWTNIVQRHNLSPLP